VNNKTRIDSKISLESFLKLIPEVVKKVHNILEDRLSALTSQNESKDAELKKLREEAILDKLVIEAFSDKTD
jgi:vacuolar-type H+-ATPase subunit E/Vma4